MTDQNKECGCVLSDLLTQLIKSNQQLLKTMESQNKVMGKIMDQNSDLMARLDEQADDLEGSQYLDG